MLLGCIADDFTGASDLANTLAKGGMRTVQFSGVPQGALPSRCEAAVIALKTRSGPASDAVRRSLGALEWLREQGCRQFFFKYCSTFDSTPEGNIGPVAEALLEALGAPFAIVCPAFPETGRTLFLGHLFVGGRLLSESGMEHHPLNPMTDPDIRRWLQRQTKLAVGLVPYTVVRAGSEAISQALLREAGQGRRLIVVDAVADEDLLTIGRSLAENVLVTGGSGIALGLPANFRAANLLSDAPSAFSAGSGPGAVLSGSCSLASRKQVAEHLKTHPGLSVEAEDLMLGRISVDDALTFVQAHSNREPIVYSTAEPKKVSAVQERFDRNAVAAAVERFFADLARRLVEAGFRRLVVGGGETSGAVVAALELDHMIVGPEIDPGVPALASDQPEGLRLALKSGNFGAEDFYAKALGVLGGP